MKLSICIISLHSRSEVLKQLTDSIRSGSIGEADYEILINCDGGATPIGRKRNRLVEIASGNFIVHCDDDDVVSPRYLPAIMGAIHREPFADAILVRGRRTDSGGESPVEFDYRIDGQEAEWVDNCLWRSPGHLCPHRADIARMVKFPEVPRAEDLLWIERMKPYVHRAVRAGEQGEVLYHYRWNSKKTWGT